jgi:Uncharacterised protein conserved in bacteria (DUF2336)
MTGPDMTGLCMTGLGTAGAARQDRARRGWARRRPAGRLASGWGTSGLRDVGLADEAGRVRLGATSTTPAEILLVPALDPSVTVRTALVLNSSGPAAAFGALSHDPDERVRTLLAGKLAALAPSLSEPEQSRLGQQAAEALGRLVEDTAVRVRAAIAEVVKEMANAPRELVLRLARDAEVRVSLPVIRISPLLTQADLLALLAASHAPEVALAVARRQSLTEDVARTADATAIRAMLLIHSTQIRESTLDVLIARAVDHTGWHAPLVRRPNLSPRAAEALSRIVADALLVELASRADLTPAVAAELRASDVSAGTIDRGGPADRPCAGRSVDRGARACRPGPADRGGVAGRRRPWRRAAGRCHAVDGLRRAAGGGRTRGDPAQRQGCGEPGGKAGFSMKLAIPLQSLLARLGPGMLLTSGAGGGFPLAIEEMRWQLAFLNREVSPPPGHPNAAASTSPAGVSAASVPAATVSPVSVPVSSVPPTSARPVFD